MRNLLSREEYIEQLNEGFIKDTIRKGVQKVKSAFNFFVKKIKNMILIFDKNGKILPVVSPQSTMNMVAGIKSVNMYAPQDVIDRTVELGGVGCETTAPLKEDDEIYNYGPDGKEFAEWIESGEYKNDIEYQNFMRIPKIVNEFYENLGDEDKKLFETMMNEGKYMDELNKERVSYIKDKNLSGLSIINTNEFYDKIVNRVIDWSKNRGKPTKDRKTGKMYDPLGNLLVFGAPGIGKSTIPDTVVEAWNKGKKQSNKISLISINCALIQPGDLLMPTLPQEKNIPSLNQIESETYPVTSYTLKNMSDAEREKMEKELEYNKQWVSGSAPQCCLPSYKPIGDEKIDNMLDEMANKGVIKYDYKKTEVTTGGGIILFDEFLRAQPGIFDQLLNLLLKRKIEGYVLGSRWAIIACSNRPVDDGFVQKVFSDWKKGPASIDRWAEICILEPDPEGWKKWIKKKGCDDLILKFIFDEKSKIGDDEYPRWHSMVVGPKNVQTIPITPRRWEYAIGAINREELNKKKKNGEVPDISQLDENDIKNALKGIFDKGFVNEFIDWLDNNKNSIDIHEIFKDPIYTPLPKAMLEEEKKDMASGTTCLNNIWNDLYEEFYGKPEELNDKKLTNLYIWLGRNFKNDDNLVSSIITYNLDKILPHNSDYSLFDHHNACIVIESAWPPEDLIDGLDDKNGNRKQSDIEYFINKHKKYKFFDDLDVYGIEFDDLDFDGKNEDEIKEEVVNKVFKKIIKTHFPWNLKKGKIVLYSNLKTNTEKTD